MDATEHDDTPEYHRKTARTNGMCGHSEAMAGAERSIAWARRNRLASKDYNRNPESSEAFLYLDSIAMLLNRLYPRC